MNNPVHFTINNGASKLACGMAFPVKGGRKGLLAEMLKIDAFTIRFDSSPAFHKRLESFLKENGYAVEYTMFRLDEDARPRYEAKAIRGQITETV